jgi:hypothetical protein
MTSQNKRPWGIQSFDDVPQANLFGNMPETGDAICYCWYPYYLP